jgi:hypothetical protein
MWAWTFSFASTAIWTFFSDKVKEQNYFTEFLTSSNLLSWNFGTSAQRLDITNWITFAHRLEFFTGSIVLLLLGATLMFHVNQIIALAWISQFVIGLLLFTNLYRVHEYYFFTLLVPSVALTSASLAHITKRVRITRKWSARYILVVAVLVMCWCSPYVVREKSVFYPQTKNELSQELSKRTNYSDPIVLLGCDWDPTTFYYADRFGLAVPSKYLSESSEIIERINSKFGSKYFKYLAFCGEPFQLTGITLERVKGSTLVYKYPD